jgi:hypothetical protein
MADLAAREQIHRLLNSESEDDNIDSLNHVREAGLKILFAFKDSKPKNAIEKETHLLMSMNILKSDSILQIAKGRILKNSIDEENAPLIYDPFSIMALVRSQFEAFCTFNSIFVYPKSTDEQQLFYLMWVISGLKYRQRFPANTPFAVQKKETERIQIDQLISEIYINEFYVQMDQRNQAFIQDRIRRKEWQCYFDGTNVIMAGWEEIALKIGGLRENLMQSLYSYLSLSSHPSNVSVFQFSDLFKDGGDKSLTSLGMSLSKCFLASMISDFTRINEKAKLEFEKLPPIYQALINMVNKIYRGDFYVVNDIHKGLLND